MNNKTYYRIKREFTGDRRVTRRMIGPDGQEFTLQMQYEDDPGEARAGLNEIIADMDNGRHMEIGSQQS
jgi:hypothetical protein